MQVLDDEGVANYIELESCAAHREVCSEALTEWRTGQPLSRESTVDQDADAVLNAEGNMREHVMRVPEQSCVVAEPGMYVSASSGNREICRLATAPQWSAAGRRRSRSR